MSAQALTPAMRSALRQAANHADGYVYTTTRTHRALVRRGLVEGITITDAGRAAVTA